MAAPEIKAEARLRRNEEKWTTALWDEGWTALPNVVLEYQAQLGLDPLDICIILHLARRWWVANDPPFPSKGTLATAIGVSPRTIQRRVTALQKQGLMKRVNRVDGHGAQRSNGYDFSGLIERCAPYAAEMKTKRADRVAERAARKARKPGLRVVK